MTSKVEAAAALAAPELALPIAAARRISRELARAPDSGVIVVPPSEHRRLLTFGKDRIHVRTRKGIRIVTVDRAPSLSAAEAVLLAAFGVTSYEVYRWKQSSSSSGSSAPSWLPTSKGWGFLRWG